MAAEKGKRITLWMSASKRGHIFRTRFHSSETLRVFIFLQPRNGTLNVTAVLKKMTHADQVLRM